MTRHVTVTLTEHQADQIASGTPDRRTWMALRRKCNYELRQLPRERDS